MCTIIKNKGAIKRIKRQESNLNGAIMINKDSTPNKKDIPQVLLSTFNTVIKEYYILFVLSVLLTLVFAINFFAGQYATMTAGPSVPDIFDFFSSDSYSSLRNLAIQVHLKWTPFVAVPVLLYFFIFFPRKSIDFFILEICLISFRALTINLTHLGPVFNQPLIVNNDHTFGGDLFFSGHVAYTFLMCLVFRDTPAKYFLILFHCLVTAATIVGRFHYTIDVIGAYAITYSLYKLTENSFNEVKK